MLFLFRKAFKHLKCLYYREIIVPDCYHVTKQLLKSALICGQKTIHLSRPKHMGHVYQTGISHASLTLDTCHKPVALCKSSHIYNLKSIGIVIFEKYCGY